MNALVLSVEERTIDPAVGYPPGFANLCRNAHKQLRGLITPFTDGPPQKFQPYSAHDDEILKFKEINACFPLVAESERDSPNARRYAEPLWQRLDHLGNAGFDPALFRVDPYGNVVFWNAEPGSPLFWEVDHWFPHARGGLTVLSNLRIVQWQVNQRKKEKLEFLIPWWDLQLGVSVNQFLSAFASKNMDFRNRCMSYMFQPNQELKQNVQVCLHSWPNAFRSQKKKCGLAAAALVKLQPEEGVTSMAFNSSSGCKPAQCSTPVRRRWSVDEEEGLRRALQKFGPGSWKEIKESEPALVNRSTVQIKDKYRLIKGDWHLDKENTAAEKQSSAAAAALQKETQLKLMKEEERKAKQAEIARIEERLAMMTEANAKEDEALEELEAILNHHQQEAEKQRVWSETQSSYRSSLERMIRDTLHQTCVYKEQARLSQVACNMLLAKLEAQNEVRQATEEELLTSFRQRAEVTEALTGVPAPLPICSIRGSDVVDVSSCLSQPVDIKNGIKNSLEDKLLPPQQTVVEEEPERVKQEEGDLQVVVVGYEYERREESLKVDHADDDQQGSGQMKVDKWLGMLINSERDDEMKIEEAVRAEEEQAEVQAQRSHEDRSKGLLSGLLKRLSLKQQLDRNLKASKKKVDPTPDSSKEWEELAVKMGHIALNEAAESPLPRSDADETCQEDAGQEEEIVDADEQGGGYNRSCSAPSMEEVVEADERRSCSTRSSYTSFDDAVSEAPAETECSSKRGVSLLESLHDEQDAPLETSSSISSESRPWYLHDWNAPAQARNGLKHSLKLCTQTWSRAMKKLESKIASHESQQQTNNMHDN